MSGVHGTDAVHGGGGESQVDTDSQTQFNGQNVDDAMGGGTEQLGQDMMSGDSKKMGDAINQMVDKIIKAVQEAMGGDEEAAAGGGEAPAGGSGGAAPAGGEEEKASKTEELIKLLAEALGLSPEQADKLTQAVNEKSSETASSGVPETAEA
jgi:hypothetical protein